MKNPENAGYTGLFTRIDQIQPHPKALKEDIMKKGKLEEFKNKKFIVRPGEISRHFYFIIEGFVRLYQIHEREHGLKEVTTWFLNTNDFMLQLNGCYYGQASPEYIQATEDTTCIKLHIDDLKWLFSKYPMFKDTYISLTELYYFQLTQRYAWNIYTAKEKYDKLLEEYPYIIQKAHSVHIASYLCISESHYCKIKNGRV